MEEYVHIDLTAGEGFLPDSQKIVFEGLSQGQIITVPDYIDTEIKPSMQFSDIYPAFG